MPSFIDEIQSWPERWRDLWEERAALAEFDAGMKRPKAEFYAYREVKNEMESANASHRS